MDREGCVFPPFPPCRGGQGGKKGTLGMPTLPLLRQVLREEAGMELLKGRVDPVPNSKVSLAMGLVDGIHSP